MRLTRPRVKAAVMSDPWENRNAVRQWRAPPGPALMPEPARRAFSLLCLVAVPLLAGRNGHCATDHTKVAVPDTPSVSVAVTVTV